MAARIPVPFQRRAPSAPSALALALALPLAVALVLACAASAQAQAPATSRAGDLELAKSAYVLKSPAFSPEARRRAVAFIDRSARRAAAMSPTAFLLSMLTIPALADNGHDVLNDSDGAWFPADRLPVRMIWFPDGWVVARAAPEFADLLGARVSAIDGLPSAEVFRRVRRYWGGPDSSRRWNLEWFIENGGILHALGIAPRADRLRLAVRLTDGTRTTRELRFVPVKDVPPGRGPIRLWSAQLWTAEAEAGWQAGSGATQPLYLEDADAPLRAVPLPELDALYVEFRTHIDDPPGSVARFTQAVDRELESLQPRNLILDLRFDTGGDTELTRDWQRTIPARIPGRIFVLLGRYTFSAGIVAVAAFKHDGGAKVTLVGEPPGDRLVWWSEGSNVCLPYSHYCPHLTTGQWNLVSGCDGNPGCYGDKYDVVVGTLAPDLAAPLTASDWLSGRDPGMEAIRESLP